MVFGHRGVEIEQPGSGEGDLLYGQVLSAPWLGSGETGTVTSNLALDPTSLKEAYDIADIEADEALATTVVQLQAPVEPVSE